MQNFILRTLLIGGIVFPVLLVVVNLLFALLMGGLPNAVQFQVISDLAFLQILWQDNPWETVKLVLIDKPLAVTQRIHHATEIQVWGMFYYVGTLVVYLLVSAFTVLHWKELMVSASKQRILFITGVIIVLLGVTYLRRAECCSSGPAWALETWLLAKVYTPNPAAVNWMQLYQRVQPGLPVLQTAVLVGGIAMLYRWRQNVRSLPVSMPTLNGSEKAML